MDMKPYLVCCAHEDEPSHLFFAYPFCVFYPQTQVAIFYKVIALFVVNPVQIPTKGTTGPSSHIVVA